MIRKIYNWVKNAYATPSAEVLALRELEESKRRLLEAQIKRLTAYLHKATEDLA